MFFHIPFSLFAENLTMLHNLNMNVNEELKRHQGSSEKGLVAHKGDLEHTY